MFKYIVVCKRVFMTNKKNWECLLLMKNFPSKTKIIMRRKNFGWILYLIMQYVNDRMKTWK